jgi:hypothetical protein
VSPQRLAIGIRQCDVGPPDIGPPF